MSTTANLQKPAKSRRWLRWLAWIAGASVILVVVLYFTVTSSAFIKGVILPKVGASLGADVTVGDLKLSPFSQLALINIKVTPKGAEPLFTAASVRVRYSLMSIIGGKIAVDEVTVESPVISIIENADGTCNLDFLNKPTAAKPAAKKPSKPAPSEAPSVDVKTVSINNATIRQVKNLKSGGRDVVEIAGVNLTLANIKNGASGKFDLSAAITAAQAARTNAPESSLNAKLSAGFTFDLTKDLVPATVQGDVSFTVEKASGALKELDAVAAKLVCEVTPDEIKQLTLGFSKGGAALGEVRASGPFNGAKAEGKIKVEVLSLDRRVLNLVGAAAKLDFGSTVINSTNEIELTQGGNFIAAAGQLDVAHLQITQQGRTSPTLDLHCDYDVSMDGKSQTVSLKKLNLTGQQDGRPLLLGALTSPMTVMLGDASGSVGDSALNITLANLNLADWKAFAPELSAEGSVNANLKLLSGQGGKQITVDLGSQITGLSARLGATAINRLDARLKASVSRQPDESLSGQVLLAGLTGSYGDYHFNGFGCTLDFDVAMKESKVEVRKLAGRLNEGLNAGGTFEVSGNFNSVTKEGKIDLRLADVNQNSLRPFLESALSGKKLVSAAINSTASVNLASGGDTDVKADFQLANLVVNDPKSSAPTTPIKLGFQLDGGVSKQVVQLRQCQLALTPTSRAKNELNLTGMVDASKPEAITGNLKLAADALDLTSYYDLFGGTSKPASTAQTNSATAATPSKPTDPTKEPDAVKLPLKDFTCDINVGRIYLHEVDAANIQATAHLDGGHLVLKPCQLTLNGAPITAAVDADLGVPGYKYDVSFNADRIPVAPLANSFSPAYRGQAKGELIAVGQIKGAGVTGRNLKKTLVGAVSLNFTNASIQVAGKAKAVLGAISLVLGAPELSRSPLDYLNVNLSAGDGKIEVPAFVARSTTFYADSQGVVPIADVLNDSPLNQDINVSLARDVANNLRFSNVPTNVAYMKLPTFVHLRGTLGSPDAKTDKAVIVGLTAAGIGGALGGKAGNILGGIGGLLGGKSGPQVGVDTNSPSSGSSSNAAPALNPFDLFKKKKK